MKTTSDVRRLPKLEDTLRAHFNMNKHEFQLLAKSFRAGRLTLEQLTSQVFSPTSQSNDLARPPSPSRASPIPRLPIRSREAHKGDFGRLLIVGGSQSMAGAVGLTGMAALRAGAGLVKIGVPASAQPIVAAFSPCFMTFGCRSETGEFALDSFQQLESELPWADVLIIGPGMGRGMAQQKWVASLFARATQPIVVDADALNALADARSRLSQHAGPRILTPHPGEFQRLIGETVSPRASQEDAAVELASQNQLIVVLKGHQTLVTDGKRSFRNQTGNPGMATGGSGDVLSGVIGALVGQGLSPFDAASLAVHWHGLAGDRAARQQGQTSLIATDIIDALGGVGISL